MVTMNFLFYVKMSCKPVEYF